MQHERGLSPSPLLWRVGFRGNAFRACSVFTARCSPHGLLTPQSSLLLEWFSPFVTSWSAPSAFGWDEHRWSGFTPEDSMRIARHTQQVRNPSLYVLVLRQLMLDIIGLMLLAEGESKSQRRKSG